MMKIGIIVHSSTGTTRRFADLIAAELQKQNHTVEVTQLQTDVPITSGTARQARKYKLVNAPDGSQYDFILAGGPVWAFSASPVILDGIAALSAAAGKRLLPFVTMAFPLKGMGGRQAISLMTKTAQGIGAKVEPGIIVQKMFHDTRKMMVDAAAEIVRIVGTK
jgi:hypothetical protein